MADWKGKGGRRDSLVHRPSLGQFWKARRMHPLHFRILQVIKNWSCGMKLGGKGKGPISLLSSPFPFLFPLLLSLPPSLLPSFLPPSLSPLLFSPFPPFLLPSFLLSPSPLPTSLPPLGKEGEKRGRGGERGEGREGGRKEGERGEVGGGGERGRG